MSDYNSKINVHNIFKRFKTEKSQVQKGIENIRTVKRSNKNTYTLDKINELIGNEIRGD